MEQEHRWYLVFLRGNAQGISIWLSFLLELGLFLLDLSSIFYFTLAPALNYWIFQGSTMSLDLWDERKWQAWLITMYLSLWHQSFKKVKENLPWESWSLKNNFDMEAEFILASPTHSSMNSCLYLQRACIMAFCSTTKKIRVQKHTSTVLSVSSYCPWTKSPPVSVHCLKPVSCIETSQSWSFLGHCNWRRRHNRAFCGPVSCLM